MIILPDLGWYNRNLFIILLLIHHNFVIMGADTIKIGGLFDIPDPFEETAFRHAIQIVNGDPSLLPKSTVLGQLERLPMGDSFHASKKVCHQLKDGVAAILGPQSSPGSSLVQSVCEVMEMPHLDINWNPRASKSDFTINLYPHPKTLSRAYADLMVAWGWTRYIIIYENNDSLRLLQDILKAGNPNNRQATLKQLPAGEEDYRPLFKEIRDQTDINTVIVACDASKLATIFDHAGQVNMIRNYRYFVTSLDIQTVDIDSYLLGGDINVTSFRILDRDKPEVVAIARQWQKLSEGGGFKEKSSRKKGAAAAAMERIPQLPKGVLKTQTALMYDAIGLLSLGLQNLDKSEDGPLETESLVCNPANPATEGWKQGRAIMDNLRKMPYEGLTGTITFDGDGYRTNFKMDVMELTQKGLQKIGEWDSERPAHFEWTRTQTETLKLQEEDLKNRTLIVSTKQSDPYFIVTNGSYEGYAIDLLDLLSEALHFNYEMRESADGSYGGMTNKSKYGWNGVIGEILEGIADVGIGDMTITHDREKTLDFTMPFMNLGISILYTIPDKKVPALFSFLEPFDIDVWIYTATAFLGVSLIMFFCSRFSPEEWQDAAPCSKDCGEVLENQFSLVNSLWFSIGSLMAQGCDILPKGTSTRTLASFWWFFNLIMISSYTANLAAFLTAEGMEGGVKDISDLPKQTKVKYGSVGSGSTFGFFRGSSFPLYKEIYNNMMAMRPSPFVSGNKEGVERVKKSAGKYAFFMESSSIEFQTERDCKLTQLGGPLDSKGYGIALRKHSKYKDAFNNRILDLQEKGELEKLKVKWWGKEKGGGMCDENKVGDGGGPKPLTLGNVGGVFVSLLGGCLLASVMAILEFLWKSRKLGRKEGESYLAEMGKDLRFALQCQGETKPVRKDKKDNNEEETESENVPYLSLDGKKDGGSK